VTAAGYDALGVLYLGVTIDLILLAGAVVLLSVVSVRRLA
jgi:hypothetical protein